MARKNRTPEEKARREKIRELLQMANIGSMDDIQNLFKETIAEFMENGLEAELDDELGYSKYDYKNKDTDNSRNGHSSKTLRTSFGDVCIRRSKRAAKPRMMVHRHRVNGAAVPDVWCTAAVGMVHTAAARLHYSGIPLRLRMDSPSIWMV